MHIAHKMRKSVPGIYIFDIIIQKIHCCVWYLKAYPQQILNEQWDIKNGSLLLSNEGYVMFKNTHDVRTNS